MKLNLKLLALLGILLMISTLGVGCGKQQPSAPADGQTQTNQMQTGQIQTDYPTKTGWPQDFPRLDGSTANIPLAQTILQKQLGISAEQADVLLDFQTTDPSYYNLIAQRADLLLVYEPSAATREFIDDQEQNGITTLEFHPIGLDALVFITNTSNPVDNLTTEQIQKIYQGEITNWRQVGGQDEPIVAYQRIEASGSQTLMRKLVMKDLTMAPAPTEFAPSEMGALIESLSTYQNKGNALGYSVYYYAQNMYSNPDLKFITVDGIEPSNTTIGEKTYPFINPFYAVIRSDEAPDSPTRRLLNWILSEEGINTLEEAGYVAVNHN